MIELALPAGTLENALVAFSHGADAVYFGLKDFSARKGAGNFSFEDLSKIRRYSIENGKKTYIAINTLIDDSSLPSLYQTLDEVAKYGTDGIICQDLGVARLIKRDFPTLALHGSTQLAVHTSNGVKALKDLGFERVVLSRELNLNEIEKIRKECPDIELKVFIHGALCYGFSGLCMASFLKTGRSANEGSCAQICRTWFNDVDLNKKLYPFSLEDMDAGVLVRRLQEIGIDSLKVEGRLKGNEYVAAVASYYRAIIDNKDHDSLHGAVQSSFQRIAGEGYLEYTGPGHKNLNTGPYTGHIGEYLGKVISSGPGWIKIESHKSINPYDGLMVLLPQSDFPEPLRFSAHIVKKEKNAVVLDFGYKESIKKGIEVRRISNSSLKRKSPSLDIPLTKPKNDISISIEDGGIAVNGKVFPAYIEEGREQGYKESMEKIFRQTGSSGFDIKTLDIENNSSFISPFIRLSELKRIRREAYQVISPKEEEQKEYHIDIPNRVFESLPDRSTICGENTPWNIDGVEVNGSLYITIPPVTYSEQDLFSKVEKAAKKHRNAMIGLNNIAHIEFAKKHPEYKYFADIYLYLSNREAASLLCDNIPSLVGGYLWLERKSYIKPWPFMPTVVENFEPPLFISRSCYRHDSLGLSCKDCSRHHRFNLEQNGERYTVFVDDCQTLVRHSVNNK